MANDLKESDYYNASTEYSDKKQGHIAYYPKNLDKAHRWLLKFKKIVDLKTIFSIVEKPIRPTDAEKVPVPKPRRADDAVLEQIREVLPFVKSKLHVSKNASVD